MRDLTIEELGHVYGAGSSSCHPSPPPCSKGTGQKSTGHKSTGHKSSKCGCN